MLEVVSPVTYLIVWC